MSEVIERAKRQQRHLIPQVAQAIAPYLIVEAPAEEDRRHNTDLIVLRLDAIRVACRIRDVKYLSQYGDEFTIRSRRPNGTETELAKILAGWGDYIFYGFASPDYQRLIAWFLGDLNIFRLWHHRYLRDNHGEIPGERVPNVDGSSDFRAYRISDLPGDFIVHREEAHIRGVA